MLQSKCPQTNPQGKSIPRLSLPERKRKRKLGRSEAGPSPDSDTCQRAKERIKKENGNDRLTEHRSYQTMKRIEFEVKQ